MGGVANKGECQSALAVHCTSGVGSVILWVAGEGLASTPYDHIA
jgi:hypothetical protein